MASLDRPKLRPLSTHRLDHQGRSYAAIEDPLGVFSEPVLIPLQGYQTVVRHFDGTASLLEIQARVRRETGQDLSFAGLEDLVGELDRALVLDGPSFARFHEDYRRQKVRPAAFAGRSYPAAERPLRSQLDRYFTDEDGAGLPRAHPSARRQGLRGILCPHIDFQRGGTVYTWSYKELVERSDAEVFVILGVAHQYCRKRFALTRKDFETPLGRVRTDQAFVDRLAEGAGDDYFQDELAHRTEHSIEFQAVFLQYLLGGRRDFTIVPILVGSFHDLMGQGREPIESDDVRGFVESLRDAETAIGKKVAYIGGIDLCHVGPEFGDRDPVDAPLRDRIRSFDAAMLGCAARTDASAWFRTAAEVENRWRVCGLAATYVMLHSMGPSLGRLLKYEQAVDEKRTCCVTFASLSFDRPEGSIPGERPRA